MKIRLFAFICSILFAIGALAQSNQTYTINVPNDFSFVLIANQLDRGNNTLNEVLPTVPDNSQVYFWDCTAQDLSPTLSTYNAGQGNWTPNATVKPGIGFFLTLGGAGPNPYPLTFTGTPHVPVLPATFPCGFGRATMLSRQTNGVGTFENITGLVPADGDIFETWNVGLQDFTPFAYQGGAWYPSTPSVPIGGAALITIPSATNNPCVNLQCPTNIVVQSCSNTAVFYSATAIDTCTGNGSPVITFYPPSGTVFPVGTNKVVCVAYSPLGHAASCSFTVAVYCPGTCIPPSIAAFGPVNPTNCIGSTVTFSVTAAGTSPLTYQWKKNNNSIPGATGTSYGFPNGQLTDSGNYSVVVNNACGSATTNTTLVVNQCGPTISSVTPATGQMGDILTITGSGFDPDRQNNCVTLQNGTRTIPLRVVTASSNQLLVLVGPVPPDATPGQIAVSTGQGAENGYIDTTGCPTCPKQIRVPWLGIPGEAGPPVPFDSLQLRPEDTLASVVIGGGTNDGTQVPLFGQGLPWTPLSPIWTFSSSFATAISPTQITLLPTPQPGTNGSWVFSQRASNGTLTIIISNDCPALTQVQVQGDFSIGGPSGVGLDIIFPRLVLTAPLPAAACAQAICDLIVAAYAQVGITIICNVTQLGSAAQITISASGGTISSGGLTLCFSPAEAGRPAPYITDIDVATAGEGDLVTITGGNFGNNPDDLCLQIVNTGPLVALRALTATDDRIVAQVSSVCPNASSGVLSVARGIGGPRSIADTSNLIVNPQPAWVFASLQPNALSFQTITPVVSSNVTDSTCPCEGTNKVFWSPKADANGVLTMTVDPNCPVGTKVCIETHFFLQGTLSNGVPCPNYIDTKLQTSPTTYSGTSGGSNCVNFICTFLNQALFLQYSNLYGPCGGYPITCAANPVTGQITITATCGCKLTTSSDMVITFCIPTNAPPNPIITGVDTSTLTVGQTINISGTGFGNNPDNVCIVLVNSNRLVPLRALEVNPTNIVAEVGPIPPDATPGRIGVALGDGSTGVFQPAFGDIAVSPAWFFQSANVGVASPLPVTPIYLPPPQTITWYHSYLSNGQVYVFLPGPCPPGTQLIMDGHFDLSPTPPYHADCWLPAVTFLQGGSAVDCARRICDSFLCGFFQRTGVRLGCRVIPQGNGALICLNYPRGTIVNGGMTVCIKICTSPPVANCYTNTVYTFAHGTTNDNFANPEPASPRPELVTWLSSVGFNSNRGYDDNFVVNRPFIDSFINLPGCITKATLTLRVRANNDLPSNDSIMLAFAGAGGVLDPVRWSAYIGAGNPGPSVLTTRWLSPNIAILTLDLSNLPLGGNQFKDLLPTLNAKGYLDLYIQDDTSVDYAILTVESCRCRADIVACAPPGVSCASVTYATPVFTDPCNVGQSGTLRVTCAPPSGYCFPIGTTPVSCTAVNALGQKARCCFLVTVRPATPPSVCPNPVTIEYSIGTTNDNFVGVEPAFPSAGLMMRLEMAGIQTFKGFDDCTLNAYFAHTFTNLPSCITSAKLTIRLKACGDICVNDTFGLAFTLPNGLNVPGWSRYLGNGNAGGIGLFNTQWSAGTVRAITLDLSALPNVAGGPTDLIPALNTYGFLDLLLQDDSAIDYAVLDVTSCCCQPDIVLTTAANQCCAVATFSLPPFSSACGTNQVICSPPSGTCFPIGTNLVQCTATDQYGQTGRCFFKVIVRDNIPPVIVSCPTNIIACQGPTNTLGTMPDLRPQVVASDNCTPASQLVISQNPPPGTLVGPSNVTFTVTDGAGNSAVCTQPITVQPCCLTLPLGMVLWLPFDEIVGTNAFNSVGGNSGTLFNGAFRISGGYVNWAVAFSVPNSGVQVPNYPAINPSIGDFSIDAWVQRDASSGNTARMIVDKRDPISGVGYSLSVVSGKLVLRLANLSGFTDYTDTGTVPADNQWHFVAVTVSRGLATGGHFYVDGAATSTFDPTLRPGTLNNTAPFFVGYSSISGISSWLGFIDEVEMFRRVLTPSEVLSLYDALSKGKCRPSCRLPWEVEICPGATSVVFTATVCNLGVVAQTYQYTFQGLPVGMFCEYPGPTSFTPSTGTVTVPPGGCVQIPVTVVKPAGMPCHVHSCFQMILVPVGTTETYVCEGSLYSHCILCAQPLVYSLSVPVGCPGLISFKVANTTGNSVDLTGTRLGAWGPDMMPDRTYISLNGLPPGTPWEVPAGLTVPAFGQITLSVNAQFLADAPGTAFTILLEADTDGDGEFEPLSSMEMVDVVQASDYSLNITRSGANLVLTWGAQCWILQQASSVLGPWTDISGATSPYIITPPLGAARFYRLKAP